MDPRTRPFAGFALPALFLVGCGSVASVVDVGPANAPPSDAAPAVDRGPTRIAVDGDANGLWWDAPTQTLLLADDNGNRILSWTDAAGIALVTELPAASAMGPGLGQLVRTADGTLVVTRFGFGATGDVVYVTPAGEAHVVPGLDGERRRIGLTVAADGTLYDSWFVRISTGARLGAVGRLELSGAEPEVITGLVKPVGVLAMGDAIYVADQDLGQVLRAPLATPMAFTVLATLETPDLLAAGPDGSIFVGTAGGSVAQIDASGGVEIVVSGYLGVRGVAYDPDHQRLFVAEHDGDEDDGIDHALHIVPID